MTEQTFECVVSADLFRRASVAISTEENRYYLNGVAVQPCEQGGALLVATDGHRLLAIRDPHAHVVGTGIVALSKSVMAAISRQPKASKTAPGMQRLLAIKGDRAAVMDMVVRDATTPTFEAYESILINVSEPSAAVIAYQWSGALIDGNFPDWRRAVGEPADQAAPVESVDASLVTPLVAALSRAKESLAFRLWPTNGGAVHVLPYNSAVEGLAIVMPLRESEIEPTKHAWLTPAARAAA